MGPRTDNSSGDQCGIYFVPPLQPNWSIYFSIPFLFSPYFPPYFPLLFFPLTADDTTNCILNWDIWYCFNSSSFYWILLYNLVANLPEPREFREAWFINPTYWQININACLSPVSFPFSNSSFWTRLQGAFPARLKKVFIVGAPMWFRVPYSIISLLLKEKLRERVSRRRLDVWCLVIINLHTVELARTAIFHVLTCHFCSKREQQGDTVWCSD